MNKPVMDTLNQQKTYVAQQIQKGLDQDLVFAEAFISGMRQLGYKSPLWALAEMIDNAVQAEAQNIHVVFGYDKNNTKKVNPDHIAIFDDGLGMIPGMISFAVRWGGTHRANDRTGFGRFGYGLPSAAVSIAKKYSVYSRPRTDPESGAEGEWHRVHVDLEELGSRPQETREHLSAEPAKPPKWVLADAEGVKNADDAFGTVIILEEMDKLAKTTGWIQGKTIEAKLLEGIGIIYRTWLKRTSIFVNGTPTEAIDPLFLSEHARYYDESPIKAQPVKARTIQVPTVMDWQEKGGGTGTVTIRASLLPPNFHVKDPGTWRPGAPPTKKDTANRFKIMKEFNGLIITREGRQIDCIRSMNFTTFQNYDRNVKIEVDFSAGLDEYFGVATSKQQIVIGNSMWERLQHDGTKPGKEGGALIKLVRDIRKKRDELLNELHTEYEKSNVTVLEPTASEQAMEATEHLIPGPITPSEDKRKKAEKALEAEAQARATKSGVPLEDVLEQVKAEVASKRFAKDFQDNDEGPFYIPKSIGEQKKFIINTAHAFYRTLYEPADADIKSALEVLLFVLGEAELMAENETEAFYRRARHEWSERLRDALEELSPKAAMADKASAASAAFEMEAEDLKPSD